MKVTSAFVKSPPQLQVVMFHSFRPGDTASVNQISLAARSVREHYPEAEIVLLTNELGVDVGLPESIALIPGAINESEIMFERTRRYRDHLKTVAPGSTVVFMDTDMLVVRRFDELLASDADLAVTVRRLRMAPINGGLIVANTARPAPVMAFFDRFVSEFEMLPPDEKRWDGDQNLLAALLDPPREGLEESTLEKRGDLTIRFAPVRVFNNTPRRWLLRLTLFRPGVRLLHFKGARKTRMPAYAARYLSPLYLTYATWADRRRNARADASRSQAPAS